MGNCRPTKEVVNKTISIGSGAFAQNFTFTKRNWYELEPKNNTNKFITDGSKQPALTSSTIKVPNGEDNNGNVTFINQTYTQQAYTVDGNGVATPLYNRECVADETYDENYFYHIFEWPTAPYTVSRTVGGFASTFPILGLGSTVSETVTASLTLAKVDSVVTGIPTGSYVYSGGTDDNKLFFTYNTTSGTDVVVQEGDVINGWTVTKVVNYIVDKSLRKRVSKNSDVGQTPSYVYVGNKEDISIGDIVKGTGIDTDTFVTAISTTDNKITLSKPLVAKTVKSVVFATATVNKVNASTLCYAEITGGSVSTPTYVNSTTSINHVFNDDANITLQLNVSGLATVTPVSLNDSGGTDDSEQRKHYLVTFPTTTVINSVNDIVIAITDNKAASGIYNNVAVSKIELVNSNSFKIWFKATKDNIKSYVRGWTIQVPTQSSTIGNFVVDAQYTASTSGASIIVKSGRGIINRSAVVGMYFSTNKKLVEYTPIFYDKSTDCTPSTIVEKAADYLIGTIILNDESELISNGYLCVNPKSNIASVIDDVYWKKFNRPVDKDKLLYWMDLESTQNISYEKLENLIIDDTTAILNGRKVIRVTDNVCGNELTQEQQQVYNPYKELSYAQNMINSLSNIAYDPCAVSKPKETYDVEKLKNIISNGIQNSIASSYITLPEGMYKQFVSNDDSLLNNLIKATDSVENSIPDKKIQILNATIKGENKSSVNLTLDKFRRLPPKFSKVDYLVSDFVFVDDKDIIVNDETNRTNLTISSIPRFTGSVSVGTQTGDNITSNGVGVLTTRSNGYIDKIETFAGSFASQSVASEINPGLFDLFTPTWVAPTTGDDVLEARPYPFVVWNSGISYQQDYSKNLSFRVEEVSNYIGECLDNRGNPFIDNIVYATLKSKLNYTDTTINVVDTNKFLSSGYLIIPKYLEKKEQSKSGNIESYFYYLGEEIIYYNQKTSNSFTQCTRGVFDTTAVFEQVFTAGNFIKDVKYIIKTLGNTNWQSIGAPEGASVGTIFTSTGVGSGSGDAYSFESTTTPFENSPDVNAVIHSYERGFKLAQFWPYKTR
jgi:hypothetical protein